MFSPLATIFSLKNGICPIYLEGDKQDPESLDPKEKVKNVAERALKEKEEGQTK